MKIDELLEGESSPFVEALKIKCPLCDQPPKKMCIGISGQNKGKTLNTVHNERLRAAGFGKNK